MNATDKMCKSCGYPAWWVDNGCDDCGFEQEEASK